MLTQEEAGRRLKALVEKYGFTPTTTAASLKGQSEAKLRSFGQYQILLLVCVDPPKASKKDPPGYVYLARKGTTSAWKIGLSIVPERRVREVQVGNDFTLQLTHRIKAPNASKAQEIEKALKLHLRARKRNTRGPFGEWFLLRTSEALALKKAIGRGEDPHTVELEKGKYAKGL